MRGQKVNTYEAKYKKYKKSIKKYKKCVTVNKKYKNILFQNSLVPEIRVSVATASFE